MELNKYENLKSLEESKTKRREKRTLLGKTPCQGKMKDDIRYKSEKIENQLLKNKIGLLVNTLLKAQEDKLSLGKLQREKTKFVFDYFLSSKKPFKFWFTSFRAPPLEIIVSSLLFSSLLFSSSFII